MVVGVRGRGTSLDEMLSRESNHEALSLRQNGFADDFEFAEGSEDADDIEFRVEPLFCFREQEVLFELLHSPVICQRSYAQASTEVRNDIAHRVVESHSIDEGIYQVLNILLLNSFLIFELLANFSLC